MKSHPPQKSEKGGMANAKMCTFLERNIAARTFACLHKFTHRLALVCKMTSYGVRTSVYVRGSEVISMQRKEKRG